MINSFRHFLAASASVALLAGFSANLPAVTVSLAEAHDFNLLTWNNANLRWSDTEGRVAVGGNATFHGYRIGETTNLTPATGSFIVGGNLTVSDGGGEVHKGSIYVGGTYSGPSDLNKQPGSFISTNLGSAVPFDFASAKTALIAKSISWGAEASTGTSLLQWSTLTLTGSDAELNIFNITAAELASAYTLTINTPLNAHVLINISGTTANFSNKGINGTFTTTTTVFNFYEATMLEMCSIGIQGSILAPMADVKFYNGQMNGQLIAKSFDGASWGGAVGQMNNNPFQNQTPPEPVPTNVPDSGSTALLLLGALAVLFTVRTFAVRTA
jgi:choice-of-anchor A domain-containing protein